MEDNLRSLGVEQLGAVNLRLLDAGHVTDPEQVVPLEEQLATMVALREEGKIAGVGISNATLTEVQTAIDLAGVVCVQNPFSLVDQHDTDVLELCAEHGVAYVPFFPLGSAFPGMPKVTDDERVLAVARRTGATPAQVGLAWLLAHRENVLLIPGTSSLDHLEQNLAVTDVVLGEADLATLQG